MERDALAERLFGATLGAMDILSVYLGDRLGYYGALATGGPATSIELAARTGTDERYAREWLEQQAVTGILTLDEDSDEATMRRFGLPAGHAEVLIDPENLAAMTPIARFVTGMFSVMPALLDAFRTGAGVPYLDFGADVREGQAGMTRPLFAHLIGTEWIPRVPELDARLRAPGARIADIGCGAGWSSIAFARAYPDVRVDGFDLDEPSIALAQRNALEAGLEDRVVFEARDAGDPTLAGRYDLVCAFECIHDMSDPVSVLRSMRRLASETGMVMIADERVADRFTAPGDDIERFMYGFSIGHCLPVGRAESPSAGTGTVIRSSTVRQYALEAGFRDVEVLPISHDWWRFYRLVG
jgi:SAM-dependent methyltransferase